MQNIHATCVSFDGKGVLFLGESGSGKSDFAFRAIMNKGAALVADDRVNIRAENGLLLASSPDNLRGLLEIRGIGIRSFPYLNEQKVDLIVELSKDIERMPNQEEQEFLGLKIKKVKINPFEISSLEKLQLILEANSNLDL